MVSTVRIIYLNIYQMRDNFKPCFFLVNFNSLPIDLFAIFIIFIH